MDPAALKADFGRPPRVPGRHLDPADACRCGTPDDVRGEVRNVFEALAPGGGYIACTSHNIQADTPLENIEALFAAYRDFGRYR